MYYLAVLFVAWTVDKVLQASSFSAGTATAGWGPGWRRPCMSDVESQLARRSRDEAPPLSRSRPLLRHSRTAQAKQNKSRTDEQGIASRGGPAPRRKATVVPRGAESALRTLEEPEKGTELSTSGVGRGGRGDVTVLVASLCACPGELIFLDKGWDGMGREWRPVAERAGRICDKQTSSSQMRNRARTAATGYRLTATTSFRERCDFFIVQQQLQRCKKKKITADQSPFYNM